MTIAGQMLVQCPEEGGNQKFHLNASFIAKTFNMSEDRVRTFMERKLFRSVVEEGVGEDAGCWRLTLRCGNRAWQGIMTEDGVIRQQAMLLVPARQVFGK
ncbi:DUF6522 family protein [Rhizobium sp. YJ-22]|uniref:DUF6522 family protein n=1 Tax=Rhizobium sp. YJ-22 TaxID=3037556 RepID=UPI002412D8AF|nr:DUF6522 family protein [Rhizobium sp. YJ-22]MDG3579962.1 DUF6522 family protein [Rhizobium sp. YJ-22]